MCNNYNIIEREVSIVAFESKERAIYVEISTVKHQKKKKKKIFE